MVTLGIDIGGSGIKGALVDTRRGVLTTERVRLKTPRPAKPDAVLAVIADVARAAGANATNTTNATNATNATGPVGLPFPGVVTNGVVRTAVHLHKSWVGVNVADAVTERLGRSTTALNDADAAGVAEVAYGAAKQRPGVVVLLTFGTGVGSGLFVDGVLVPNTELGHLPLDGADAESQVADSVRDAKKQSWKKWAKQTNAYLALVDELFSPDLLVIGGGIVKYADEFMSLLRATAPLRVAALGNEAGIVGAALVAERAQRRQRRGASATPAAVAGYEPGNG
jgi:polyphosphate glucokinase